MSDPYTDLLAQPSAATGAAGGDPYGALLGIDTQQQRLRASVSSAVDVPAAQAAQQRTLARKLGTPEAAVAALPDDAKRSAAMQQVELDTAAAPVLRRRYTDADFAKLAQDDSGVLSKIEAGIGGLGKLARYLVSADDDAGLVNDIKAGYLGAKSGYTGVARAFWENLIAPVGDVLEVANQPLGLQNPNAAMAPTAFGNPLRQFADVVGNYATEQRIASEKAASKVEGNVMSGVSSGVQSLTQNAALLPAVLLGAPEGAALTAMSLLQGGQSYQKAREAGVGSYRSLAYGASDAVIEYATEKIPLHRLIGDTKAGTSFFKTLAVNAGLEIPGEQIATALQDANEWATLHPEKTLKDYLEARPDAAIQTLVATLVGSGGQVSILHAVQKAADNATGVLDRSTKADAFATQMQNLFAAAGESQLRGHASDVFAETIQAMADEAGGTPSNVYVDARTLGEVLQQSGLTPEQFAQILPTASAQMDQALVQNAPVEIPVGELLANATGTPLQDALLQHLRSGPDELSQAEAKEAFAQGENFVKDEATRIAQQAQQRSEIERSADVVKANILEQLNTAGRFRPEANEMYAQLVRAFYSTTAQRLGVTPEELYARFPLRVTGEMDTGEALEQGENPTALEAEARQLSLRIRERANADRAKGLEQISDETLAANKADGERISALMRQAEDLRRKPAVVVAKRDHAPEWLTYATKQQRATLDRFGEWREDQGFSLRPAGESLNNSASASFTDYEVLPGVRSVNLTELGDLNGYDDTNERKRIARLANELKQNREVEPIFVGVDADGEAWVMEGQHRARAFKELGLQAIPARVVVDFSDSDTLAQRNRATFSPSQILISLGPDADFSSFLHEMGHFWLETMDDIATQPGAPEQVQKDWATTLEWFGLTAEQWAGMDLEQKRPYHERWAESTEQYFFEAKAPSVELRGVFDRFKKFMEIAYQVLVEQFVAVQNRNAIKLSDEIRGVMDRLIATDEQIAEMEQVRQYGLLFKSPEEAGMTPEQWAKYISDDEKAHGEAVAELQRRALRDMGIVMRKRMRALRAVQNDMAEKRKAVEQEARVLVEQEPVYKAMRWLKKGEVLLGDGTVEKTEGDHKLDANVLAEDYAADVDKLKGMAVKKGGLHPDIAAEQLGYSSGDELVKALLAADSLADAIEGTTDRMMLERFGDLVTARGQERAADEAVHNENRARVLATELAAYTAARQSPNVLTRAAKVFAEKLMAGRKLRDIRPSVFSSAETRAARAAEKAKAKGDIEAATIAKRDQVLNFQSARVAMAAQDEVAKGLAYLKKFEREGTRKNLPTEYLDQIDKLMERVEIRQRTNRELDKRAKLAAWIKEQEDIGVEPEIPGYLLEDAQLTNYRELTLDEFRGLIASVKQIEHLGRLKGRLLSAKDKREFAAVVEDIAASVITNGQGRKADTRTPADWLGKTLQSLRTFGYAHIKAATLARIADGGADGGPMWERFIRPANDAADTETTMRAEATEALTKILAPWLKAGKLGGKGRYFETLNRSLNREQLLAIALNTGNEGNLQRLLDGEGWTLAQLQPALDTLTARDWQTAQAIWDHFESYRPQVAELERDVFGREPDWVEPGSDVTKAKGVRGGYYPIKYDTAASIRAEQNENAEAAKRQLQGAYNAATVRKSFTKARSEEVKGRPLLLTLAGVYAGVNDQIHYLAWQRWLVDTNRLLRSKTIDSALRSTYGPQFVRQLRTWRDAIAEGDSGVQEALDQFSGKLRQSVSMAGLGFNVMTALTQPLGYIQSAQRIGVEWAAKGLQQYVASPIESAKFVNEKSDMMANRARTRFRELNELRNRVEGQTTAKRVLAENAYRMILVMQRIVDVPTWLGAYEKAIADGQAEDRAVSLADQAVIDSQGGGQTKDLAAIERGSSTIKLFTVFYSFMNTTLNLAAESAHTDSKAKAAVNFLTLTALPAVLLTLFKAAVTPGGDDWDDPEKLAKKLVGESLANMMQLFVGVREFVEAMRIATGTADHGGRDYAGPAGVRMIADTGTFAKQAAQGELDDAFRKASINLAGDLFGIPSAQLNRSITGANALASGDTKNPAAVVFGYQKPK